MEELELLRSIANSLDGIEFCIGIMTGAAIAAAALLVAYTWHKFTQ